MKHFFLLWVTGSIGIVLLIGSMESPPRQRGFVTQIDIYSQMGTGYSQRHITDRKQMSAVLNYLRALKRKGEAPDTPAPDADNTHTICTWLSDGRCHIYRLQSGSYICKDNEGWKLTKYQDFLNLFCY